MTTLELKMPQLIQYFVHLQNSGDESAVLWLDQIQEAIHAANQDAEEALTSECLFILFYFFTLLNIAALCFHI